jgi:hypothetical protein
MICKSLLIETNYRTFGVEIVFGEVPGWNLDGLSAPGLKFFVILLSV